MANNAITNLMELVDEKKEEFKDSEYKEMCDFLIKNYRRNQNIIPIVRNRNQIESLGLERTLRGHTGSITSVAISSNNEKIISGSWDKTIKIWNIE